MNYQIVGILKNRPYSMDDQRSGKHYEGVSSRLYLASAVKGETSENLSRGGEMIGRETMYIKVPRSQHVEDFHVGDIIQFYYNKYRQIDQVIKVQEAQR